MNTIRLDRVKKHTESMSESTKVPGVFSFNKVKTEEEIMDANIEEIIKILTLEEKASLCSGMDFWHTKPLQRLNIPNIMVADGPHGLRKQASKSGADGLGNSEKSTCFPTASATACAFDPDLMYEMGQALGEECLDQGISVILGPGANIKRSPGCGRNFEYISEDPFVIGKIAGELILGIQSKHVGTSLKHFAANNQEKARMLCDSVIDERALREIYLSGFEAAVKSAKPWTLMCSYNLLNGIYASEHPRLLTEILRKEWGFEGIVMSDWTAVCNRVKGLAAGLELEMPGSGGENDRFIIEAVKNGSLSEEILDQAVRRLLTLIYKGQNEIVKDPSAYERHNSLARKIALASAVLLKNDGLLPANPGQKAAVLGAFAKEARYQGSGSSRINPAYLSNAVDGFKNMGIDYAYADGYKLSGGTPDEAMIHEAVETARGKEIVFIYAGLPDEYESEGFDRDHMDLPDSHNQLISEVVKVNPNVVVILFCGSPVVMPWLPDVKSVLLSYLSGQAGAEASVDLLYGKSVPCGKLAETFPLCHSDNPSYTQFGDKKSVEYRESIYVGYRYYDAANKKVLFPFGFGLSYSSFVYKNLRLSANEMLDSDPLTVTVDVQNTGNYDAKEIVQIYVQAPKSVIFKAPKELKGFAKIDLKKGETGTVTVQLDHRSFAYYNTNIHDWHVESGIYTILAGASSKDIRLSDDVKITSTRPDAKVPDYSVESPAYYHLESDNLMIPQNQFEAMYGAKMRIIEPVVKGTYNLDSAFFELDHGIAGTFFVRQVHRRFMKKYAADPRSDQSRMFEAQFDDMPVRTLVSFTNGALRFDTLEGLLLIMNGHMCKGLMYLWKNRK